MLKGLIFDLDGVITDTAIFHYQAWKQVVKQFQIDLTAKINEEVKGFPRRETLEKIFEIFNFDINELSNEQIETICDEKNQIYLNLIQTQLNENSILPGIKQLLDDAKNHNLKIALASSSRNANLILEKLKITQYFDYLADPSLVKNAKPSPDIYLLAAKGLNLNIDECVGFEDAIIGIQGLNDANIYSIGISADSSYIQNNSQYYVKSTNQLELVTIIQKFNN